MEIERPGATGRFESAHGRAMCRGQPERIIAIDWKRSHAPSVSPLVAGVTGRVRTRIDQGEDIWAKVRGSRAVLLGFTSHSCKHH